MKRRCVSYIRVSTAEQASHGHSIQAQQQMLRDYALGHEFEIVHEFVESESAFKPGRPEFKAMLTYLKRHRDVAAVLCYKIDRLYRNMHDYAELDEMDWVTIVSATEGLPENATGKLVGVIQAGMSRFFSHQLSERVSLGMETKAKHGLWPSYAPVGYVNQGRGEGIEPDPERADLVRELFRKYVHTGMTLNELTEWARRKGLRTRQGGSLSRSAIHKLLSNPIYMGVIRWRGTQYQGTHEPLISAELFQRAQDTLQGRGHTWTERSYPYRGLLLCGRCGCKITASLIKGKYAYYHCTGARGGCDVRYLRQDRLGEALVSVVKNVHLTSEQVQALLQAMHDRQGEREKERQQKSQKLQGRLEKIVRRREAAYEDKLDGKLSEDRWLEMDQKWSWEEIQVRHEIATLADDRGPSLDDVQATLELVRRAPELYLRQNDQQRARLLKVLVWNCKLTGESIEPIYRTPFDVVAEGRHSNNWYAREDSNPYLSVPGGNV